jgi:hypothetical protein
MYRIVCCKWGGIAVVENCCADQSWCKMLAGTA